MNDYRSLIQAIDNGDVKALGKLLTNGNPNKRNKQKETALMHAAKTNSVTCLKHLVKNGARLNNRDIYKNTALIKAARVGSVKSVQTLVEMGARVDLKMKNGKSALTFACEGGHFEMVKCLVEAGANVNAVSRNHVTPLLLAVSSGDCRIVKYLIKKGAKDIEKTPCLETPLTKACRQSKTDIVKVLVDSGFDVNRPVNKGRTALMYSAEIGNLDMVKMLVEAGADLETFNLNQNPLMQASAMGHVKVYEYLMSCRANVNAMNKFNSNAFMAAARSGNAQMVRALLRAGCNVNLQNVRGETALFFAVRRGHLDTVNVLLSAGAMLNHISNAQETVLHVATENGNPSIMLALLDVSHREVSGIDVNYQDEDGKTALFQAARKFNSENVRLLLKAGADPNSVTCAGETALEVTLRTWVYMVESKSNHIIPPLTTIDYLLAARANTKSLLGFLITKWQHELVRKMIIYGTLPNHKAVEWPSRLRHLAGMFGEKKCTPFFLALSIGNIGCAAYLAQNLFLTKEDMMTLRCYRVNADPFLELLCNDRVRRTNKLLNSIMSQPWTLASLSFMAVSISIGFKSPEERKERVAGTMLPATLQKKLMFADMTKEPVDAWSKIAFECIHSTCRSSVY